MSKSSFFVICVIGVFALGGCGGGDQDEPGDATGGADVGSGDVVRSDVGADVSSDAALADADDGSGGGSDGRYELKPSLEALDSAKFDRLRATISRVASCETAFNDCPNQIREVSTAERSTDVAGCVSVVTDWFDGNASTQAAVEAGTIIFDEQAARACLTAMLESRNADVCNEAWGAEIEACEDVYTGTIANGESCGISSECVAGACERNADPNDPNRCEGTCAKGVPTVGEGDSCGRGVANCDRTRKLLCTPDPDNPDETNCAVRGTREQGEACRNDWSCVDGLVCDEGVCATGMLAGVGDECIAPPSNSTAASSKPCAPGLACGELDADDNGTCVDLSEQNGPCDDTDLCKRGLYCDTDAGNCEPTKGEGEVCSNWDECRRNLSCRPSGEGEDTCRETPTADAC